MVIYIKCPICGQIHRIAKKPKYFVRLHGMAIPIDKLEVVNEFDYKRDILAKKQKNGNKKSVENADILEVE